MTEQLVKEHREMIEQIIRNSSIIKDMIQDRKDWLHKYLQLLGKYEELEKKVNHLENAVYYKVDSHSKRHEDEEL